MADAVVVITSLTLELTLRGIAQEVASLLIFFRLWRILRVMHGVAGGPSRGGTRAGDGGKQHGLGAESLDSGVKPGCLAGLQAYAVLAVMCPFTGVYIRAAAPGPQPVADRVAA